MGVKYEAGKKDVKRGEEEIPWFEFGGVLVKGGRPIDSNRFNVGRGDV